MYVSGNFLSTAYQIKMKNSIFPTVNPATGKKWKNAELFQECETLTSQVQTLEDSESLKTWTDIINAAKDKTSEGSKVHNKEIKLAWRDLKTIYSTLSFEIDHAKRFLKKGALPAFLN